MDTPSITEGNNGENPQGYDDQHIIDDPATQQPKPPEDMDAAEHTNSDSHDVVDTQRNFSSIHQGEHVETPVKSNIVGGKSISETETDNSVQTHNNTENPRVDISSEDAAMNAPPSDDMGQYSPVENQSTTQSTEKNG